MKKIVLSLFAALLLSAAPASAQTTNSELKRAILEKLEQAVELLQLLPSEDPAVVRHVRPGEDLQAALDQGGTIELEMDGVYSAATYVYRVSKTVVLGRGARIHTTAGPAIDILPGVHGVEVEYLTATSAGSGDVVRCGANDETQTKPELQPTGIVFRGVKIPTHRGKNGFAIHCNAALLDSSAVDVVSAAGVEDHALLVLNTCGPVTVIGGDYSAADINVLVGGDMAWLPCEPTLLRFSKLTLTKPDAWRGKETVKNLFEVKRGRDVALTDSWLSNCWASGQGGTAIVITPRNGGAIEQVVMENLTVDHVALGIQILGLNDVTPTPWATRGIAVRRSSFAISKAENGGRGIFALIVEGTQDVTVEDVDVTFDGNTLVESDSSRPQGPFTMRDSRTGLGTYGIRFPGSNYGTPATGAYVNRALAVVLERNTFTPGPGMSSGGLAAMKKNFPDNTFLAR